MPNPLKVVLSLTTMPDRYDYLYETLKSIQNIRKYTEDQPNQPNSPLYSIHKVYLCLPKFSQRLNIPYPPIPDNISSLCTILHTNTDYGPATKLLPILQTETDLNTIIITLDDDKIYPESLVHTLIKHHISNSKCVIGSAGMLINSITFAISTNERSWSRRVSCFKVPDGGRYVDVIYGYPGALYVRWMFEFDEIVELVGISNDVRKNDDVMISGYLRDRGVRIKIFNDVKSVIGVGDMMNQKENSLSGNLIGFMRSMSKGVEDMKKIGYFKDEDLEDVAWYETIWGIVLVDLIIVIGVVLVVGYFVFGEGGMRGMYV